MSMPLKLGIVTLWLVIGDALANEFDEVSHGTREAGRKTLEVKEGNGYQWQL